MVIQSMAISDSVSDFDKFRRFLVLGSEAGIYKAGSRTMLKESSPTLPLLLNQGRGEEVVQELHKVQREGLGRKDSVLLALALCARSPDMKTRQSAYKGVKDLCQTPVDLFMFLQYCKQFSDTKGWGRSQRRAVFDWYNSKEPKHLAELTTRYKSRVGWSHKDVLRLTHVKATSSEIGVVLKYIVKGFKVAKEEFDKDDASDDVKQLLRYLEGVDTVKHSTDHEQVARLVDQFSLSREHIPTPSIGSKEIWTSLVQNIPVHEILSNISKIASVGLLDVGTSTASTVCDRLSEDAIKQEHICPLSVIMASQIYGDVKGKVKWTKNESFVDCLNKAFQMAVKNNISSTGKRYLIGAKLNNATVRCTVKGAQVLPPLTAIASTVSILAQTESVSSFVFYSLGVVPLELNAETSMAQICEEVIKGSATVPLPFISCDVASPVKWALENKTAVDVFLLFTDSKDSSGEFTPAETLKKYRSEMNIPDAKLIVCGLANGTLNIIDPKEPGMLAIAGFDSSVIDVIQNFAIGKIC